MKLRRIPLYCVLAISIGIVLAQVSGSAEIPSSQASLATPAGAPVIFGDETLFEIYDQLGPFTSQNRAVAIAERLTRLANDRYANIESVTATEQESPARPSS